MTGKEARRRVLELVRARRCGVGTLARMIRICVFAALVQLSGASAGAQSSAIQSRQFLEDFDGQANSWAVDYDRSRTRLETHRRVGMTGIAGERVELLQIRATVPAQRVELTMRVPPSRVHDDLAGSVWVRSDHLDWTVWLQVVFPSQKDPRTGQPVQTWMKGESYSKVNDWQELKCATTSANVRQQLQLLRRRLGIPLSKTDDAYVQSIMLSTIAPQKLITLVTDKLSYGPVVNPAQGATSDELFEVEAASQQTPVKFELGRLSIGGQAMFLRLVPYHDEQLEVLEQSGVNTVWVPEQDQQPLLQQLRQRDLWAVTVPPRARALSGEDLPDQQASLVPFGDETLPILGWYLGTRIPEEKYEQIISRARQIRGADRRYRRPLMADVTGNERIYSRHVSMLSSSRHALHTTLDFRKQRDWLSERRQTALPGSFIWTWIQTEAVSATADWRSKAGRRPIVVEPEQLRLQVYSAISAGCRGIGYWKTTPLDSSAPGGEERRHMIAQLNLELDFLNDWLADGRLLGHVELESREAPRVAVQPKQFDYRRSPGEQITLAQLRERQRRLETDRAPKYEAAMIRSSRGVLLLPMYFDPESQFVPGRMVTRDVHFVVPGVPETASAYEITTTSVRSLDAERDTGGMRVVLPELDQTSIILLTTDQSLKQELEQRVRKVAEQSARLEIKIVTAKLYRVHAVINELKQLTAAPNDTVRLLQRATQTLADAGELFQQGDFDQARKTARTAAQYLRILQRAYWDEAVWKLSSPVASCHTVCFQTLPDHWEMLAALGAADLEQPENLLRSGDFEDIDAMVVEGWKHAQNSIPGVQAGVDLNANAREGRYSLRMFAVPESAEIASRVVTESPVVVSTPKLTVHAGQILHVSGWIRVTNPTVGSHDGCMIYDSIAGPPAAQRWSERCDWRRFELLREVSESGPFQLSFALTGMGEVQLDDLRVIAHQPGPRTRLVREPDQQRAKPRRSLIKRLSGLASPFERDKPRR